MFESAVKWENDCKRDKTTRTQTTEWEAELMEIFMKTFHLTELLKIL